MRGYYYDKDFAVILTERELAKKLWKGTTVPEAISYLGHCNTRRAAALALHNPYSRHPFSYDDAIALKAKYPRR